jgi:hypothetical protein
VSRRPPRRPPAPRPQKPRCKAPPRPWPPEHLLLPSLAELERLDKAGQPKAKLPPCLHCRGALRVYRTITRAAGNGTVRRCVCRGCGKRLVIIE